MQSMTDVIPIRKLYNPHCEINFLLSQHIGLNELTLRSCVSIPGRIIMTDTIVPRSRKKEKTSRVTVELLEDGQQPHTRHGAEPHRHDAWGEMENDMNKNFPQQKVTKSSYLNKPRRDYKPVVLYFKYWAG